MEHQFRLVMIDDDMIDINSRPYTFHLNTYSFLTICKHDEEMQKPALLMRLHEKGSSNRLQWIIVARTFCFISRTNNMKIGTTYFSRSSVGTYV